VAVVFENVTQVLAEAPAAGTSSAQSSIVVRGGYLVLEGGQRVELATDLLIAVNDLLAGLNAGKIGHVDLDEELLSPERAGELLGITRPTVYAWQDRGLIERVDRGGKRLVPLASVIQYREQQQQRRAFAATLAAASDPSEERAVEAAKTFANKVDLGASSSANGTAPAGRRRRRPIVAG